MGEPLPTRLRCGRACTSYAATATTSRSASTRRAGDPPGPPRRPRAARRPLRHRGRPARPGGAALAAGGRPAARGRRAGVGHRRPDARRAAEAQFGEDAARRLAARAEARIGLRAPTGTGATVRGLLRGAGVGLAAPGDLPTAWLVVSEDEPLRGEIDPLVREGAPHLLVVCGAAARSRAVRRARPDRLPALRRRPPGGARPTAPPRGGAGGPSNGGCRRSSPSIDAEVLALAWAVRDLARYAEGDRPSTWSATVEIGHARPRRTPDVAAASALRVRLGRRLVTTHHHSLSSLPSIAPQVLARADVAVGALPAVLDGRGPGQGPRDVALLPTAEVADARLVVGHVFTLRPKRKEAGYDVSVVPGF